MRIVLQDLSKQYSSVTALDSLSLEIEPGQIVALLGANGAGKTTLLRMLSGVAGADRGKVLYDDQEFNRGRVDLRRRFHFLPDFPAVFEHWTPLQHLGMVLRLYEVNSPDLPAKVAHVLDDLDLLPVAEAPFATLSRGQRYKAALAALVVMDPELWLLDEPFASGMDPHGINFLKRQAREAAARGRTIIYSTQILDAAERFSDAVCVIQSGQVRAFGPIESLQSPEVSGMSALEAVFTRLREEEVR